MRWRRDILGSATLAIGLALWGGGRLVPASPSMSAGRQADHARLPALPPFRAGIDVVALNVCVTGRDGRGVSGLSVADFQVLDDNRLQQPAFLLPDDRAPLGVVLLIDRSSSMQGTKLDRALGAAAELVNASRPEDLIGLLAFNETVTRLVPMGRDHAAVQRALAAVDAEGRTALYDAVRVAARDLDNARQRLRPKYRFAIVVLSDGEDTASRVSFDDVIDDARRSSIVIYPVSLRSDERGRWQTAPFTLAQLAFETGGRTVSTADPNALSAIYRQIYSELRGMYTLGYVPTPAARDRTWHAVSVRVPGHDAVVRTRAGYYAGAPQREK